MTSKLFPFILLFLSLSIYSQEARVDSLLHELDESEVYDEKYVDLVNELSFEYLKSDPLKAPYYTNLGISVAKQIGYNQGLIRATTNKGSTYWINGLLDEALSYYLLSLSYDAEKFPLEYARINNNIGEVFKKKSLYDSAQKYYSNALETVNKNIPDQSPVILLSNVGEAMLLKNEIDSAELYYQMCLKNSLKDNNKRGLAYAYYGLGEIAFYRYDVEKAEELQQKSLGIWKEINDTRGIIQSMNKLGTYQIHSKDSSFALAYWDEAERLAVSFRALDLLNEIYLSKSEFYYLKKQYKEAAEYIGAYTALSDSIKSAEFSSSLERTKIALLREISDAENKLLKQQQEQSKKENRITAVYLTGGIVVTIAVLIILRFYRNRKKELEEIASEKEMNDSLIMLSKEVNERSKTFDDFISKFLEISKKVLSTDRASYWYYDNENEKLICYRLIDDGFEKESKHAILKKNSPSFFKELLSNRTFAVTDVKTDPRCQDVDLNSLFEKSITSFIVSPLFLNDMYVGLIGFSMIDEKRDWSFSNQRYVGSLADIMVSALANNEKSALEKEKESLIEKLLKKNKSLMEFNSVISHNVREPLAQVIGFSNLLSKNNDLSAEEWSEVIARLNQSSGKIDSVIKDLSTLLNEQDVDDNDLKKVSISKVFNEVRESLSQEIVIANPIIKKQFDPLFIHTYKPFLYDIIYHLLSNAIKFRKADERLKVGFSSNEDEKNIRLSFTDNGRGIDLHSFKDRIFKMYMRHHHDVEGRGVGLYIARNRVESLNGKIEVESEVNKGTTFNIFLPKTGAN